jgi:hypothetical protein
MENQANNNVVGGGSDAPRWKSAKIPEQLHHRLRLYAVKNRMSLGVLLENLLVSGIDALETAALRLRHDG